MPQTCGPLLAIAQRLEGDHHLGGPAALEAGRPDAATRCSSSRCTARRRSPARACAPSGLVWNRTPLRLVVERVEHERHAVAAVEDVDAVVAQLVGDDPLRLAVEHARGEVEVVVVEEDPGLVFSVAGAPSFGTCCTKSLDRQRRLVDRLVELAVDLERAVETNRTDGDAPLLILCPHRRSNRLGRHRRRGGGGSPCSGGAAGRGCHHWRRHLRK